MVDLENLNGRVYDFPLLVFYDWAVECQRVFRADISGGGSGAEGERTRLGDEAHMWIIEGQAGGMNSKGDQAACARRERDARKAKQQAVRPGYRGHVVAAIELHYLVSGHFAAVPDLDGYLNWLSDIGGADDQIAIHEGGIAQAVPEGEERCGRRVDIIAEQWHAVRAGALAREDWHLAD